jgi:hypothetical protein
MLTPENAVATLKKAASVAERQRAFRARQRADGLIELRGVWVRPEDAERVRRYAARVARSKRNG